MTKPKDSGSIAYLVGVCLAAALGGLLFGYDTGVIKWLAAVRSVEI